MVDATWDGEVLTILGESFTPDSMNGWDPCLMRAEFSIEDMADIIRDLLAERDRRIQAALDLRGLLHHVADCKPAMDALAAKQPTAASTIAMGFGS